MLWASLIGHVGKKGEMRIFGRELHNCQLQRKRFLDQLVEGEGRRGSREWPNSQDPITFLSVLSCLRKMNLEQDEAYLGRQDLASLGLLCCLVRNTSPQGHEPCLGWAAGLCQPQLLGGSTIPLELWTHLPSLPNLLSVSDITGGKRYFSPQVQWE